MNCCNFILKITVLQTIQIVQIYNNDHFKLMNWDNEKSQAIPFIVKDQSDNYVLTPQAQSFLNTLNGPLSIISVAGLYRTGKSYLLNRVILNRSSGFGVGPSVNPCTKGLWLWAEPIKVAEGRTMLVIDTEGLGALDEQTNHDMKIFSLAVLLSTNFIYNSVGSIDQTALQTLSLALQLISTIDKDNFSSRPSLLWVIRDFSLQLINDNGAQITSRQYLELALSTEHLKEAQKIQLRKVINQAFSHRDCFTMIKPLIDEQKLQALDKVSSDELRPQFVSQTITLRKNILNSLREMKLNNSGPLNGGEYTIMVKKYLTAINAGQVPNLTDTWTFIRTEKARFIAETVRQSYNEKLRMRLGSRIPLPAHKLNDILTTMRKQATEQFLKDSYEECVSQEVVQFLNACEAEMHKVNSKQSKNVLNDLLRREFEPFQKKLLSEYYSDIGSYENDLRMAFTKTLPEKLQDKIDISLTQLELFAERRITEAAKIFERRARDDASKAKQMKSQAETALQTELRNMGRSIEEERKKYQEELLSMERKIIGLSSEKQRLQTMMERERKDEAMQTQKLRRRAEQNQSTLQNFQNQIKRLSSLSSEQERTLFSLKKQLEKEKALSSQKQQYMSTKLQQQERKIHQLSSDYEKDYKQWQNEKKQLIGGSQTQTKALILENKDYCDQIQQLTQLLEQEKYTRSKQQEEFDRIKSKHQDDILQYKEKLLNSNKKSAKKQDQQSHKVQQITQNLVIAQKQLKQWQVRHKQQTEQLKSTKSNFEKQLAIYTQKIEFQQIQISDLRAKNKELNQSYQRYLENVHTDNQGVEETYSRKINELNQEHRQTIAAVKQEFENKITNLTRDNNSLSKTKQQLELQLSMENKKSNDAITELRQNLKNIENSYKQAMNRLSTVEMSQCSTLEQKERYYENKIRQLESELETVTEKAAAQLDDFNKKTEINISELKNYADQQRQQWEKRLQEEKQRTGRKLKDLNEDFNRRMAEEKEILETEIQELTQKLQITEHEANEQIQAMRTDYEIKLQKMGNGAIEERMDLNKRIALLTQQAEMTKNNLVAQLQQKTKTFQHTLETKIRQMSYEFEQQLKMVKEALEESEHQNDALRKAHRTSEQTNLVLKAEIDKDKAIYKEKMQNAYRERREIQERYMIQIKDQNRAIEELNTYSNQQIRRLTEQIQQLRKRNAQEEQQNYKNMSDFEQEKTAFQSKIAYLQSKIKRSKDDYNDVLAKFQSTVKTLSRNNKNQYEREFHDKYDKMKEQYSKRIREKEESLVQQRKQMEDKMVRLQTENKTLRDKVLIFQMRQTGKKGKSEDLENELYRQKSYYQKQINQLKRQIDRLSRSYRPSERDHQSTMRLQRSKISDRSERFSNISEFPLDLSANKSGLRQNKSMINNRPSITVKKQNQQKRYMNADEVTGVMKWNH